MLKTRVVIPCALLLLAVSVLRAADGPGAAAFAAMLKARSAGNSDAALKAAAAALKAEPKNATYLVAIGGLYCEQAQQASIFTRLSWAGKCRTTWEQALAIDPKNIDLRNSLIQYYAQAPGLAGGSLDKAREQATAIAALDAVRGELAWAAIARIQKQGDEAERHLKKAAEIDASGVRGPVALAGYYASLERWPEAKAIFESRLARNADDAFAAFQLARLLQRQNVDPARSLRLFDQYLAIPPVPNGPSHADAWFRKGEVLSKLGRTAEAIAAFDAALKLEPGHAGATRARKQIK
jgi:tetratricopeptide (TPR) repeat protein